MKAFAVTLAGLLLPALSALAADPAPSAAKVVDLRVERMTNPTAVNHPLPRFSWRIETEERGWLQTSYHLLAASSPELLAQDKGDLWDSEERPGRKSQLIEYGGAPLTTGDTVYWKVRSKNRSGHFTEWGEPAVFSIALSGPPSLPTPLFLPVSEAPRLSSFECSDSNLSKIYTLAAERLHEIEKVRDIGLVMRAAAYHQDIQSRASAWLHQMNASVDAADFYPAKLPSDGTYGSTQSDAAISATHALWWMTGDSAVAKRHLPTMLTYVSSLRRIGLNTGSFKFGDLPGDTLPPGDPTPSDFVHLTSQAINVRLISEMGRYASSDPYQMRAIEQMTIPMRKTFAKEHFGADGTLKYNSLPAHILALRCGLLTQNEEKSAVSKRLSELAGAESAAQFGSSSPMGALNLLPLLGWIGELDKATMIARSQKAEELATLPLIGISEWLIGTIAGIGTENPGFDNLILRPRIGDRKLISSAKAHYDIQQGRISIHWYFENTHDLILEVRIPPNTTAHVTIPVAGNQTITESGQNVAEIKHFIDFKRENGHASFRSLSGSYRFKVSK